jgi:hypothetical protein
MLAVEGVRAEKCAIGVVDATNDPIMGVVALVEGEEEAEEEEDSATDGIDESDVEKEEIGEDEDKRGAGIKGEGTFLALLLL